MLRRAIPRGAFSGAGLESLGRLIVRHPVLVIVGWVLIAVTLFLSLPPLMEVAERKPPGLLPDSSSVMIAGNEMGEAFAEGAGSGNSGNVGAIIFANENGLTPEDEATYRKVVDRLHAMPEQVLSTQDFVSIPELRQVMTSEDKKAWQLPISMQGTMGTGEGQRAYKTILKEVNAVTEDSDLEVNVIGPAATFDDLNKIGHRDQLVIEIVTVVAVLSILIMVYRNVVAIILPMLMIGVGLVVAQSVVAGLGDLEVIGLGPQTLMLMTAMMMGAGTDYAIFFFTRYHELIREGLESDDAVITALGTIGKVIAGSAGTTALAFYGLAFTKLGAFSTVGPALGVTVLIGFLVAVTLLPAMIVLTGRRGWVKPRKDLTSRWWRRSGIHIVRRPVFHLAVSLVILIGLAACFTMIRFNYDERTSLPADASSNIGYAALDKHFPISSTIQQFLLVQAPDQDLRSPKALADMEEMAKRVAALPDIDMIRGITRPTGEVLEQAKATYQAGEVGSKLGDASQLIEDNDANLNLLSGGADKLADTLDQLRDGVVDGIVTLRPLAKVLTDMQEKYGGTTTLEEIDKTATLVANMKSLGDAMGDSLMQMAEMYSWAGPIVKSLNSSPVCNVDPSCVESRAYLQRITKMNDDGTAQKVANLGRVLQETEATQTLDETVRDLGTSMKVAVEAIRAAGLEDTGSVQAQLAEAQEGANLLADSSRQLAEGVQLLVDQTRNMGGGLDQASAFLMAMRSEAKDPPMAGFYVPPQILTQEEFQKAAKLFISPDGHTARYLVQTGLNPFGTEAMDQVDDIIKAAESAKPNTSLADAKISMVGFSAVQNDIRNYYNGDVRFIIIVTLLVVLLILVVLLKSLVAPIYLVGSVILSYVSALGIGVVFFQFILGQGIHWSVPGMTFLVLVAVGADYNLLLIARIRDEAARGIRTAVIRTVTATGSVITSAGLIFAASMFGLTFSSLQAVVQIGFVIGIGLLLDTFLVRTITVPALAVLIGDRNWWPSKPTFDAKPLVTPFRGVDRSGDSDEITEPIPNSSLAEADSDDFDDDEPDRTDELVSVGGGDTRTGDGWVPPQ
ncbi:RND family transporter [Mycolicibacterium flavescens]|uniref:MMPL/RND family transporter n=1 Tax=Mycolicibacterium flavescens TaxID=1776 RepID=UPI000A05BD0C|nr:RND family transporter [Mycolicibacterium flavescens]MCV7282687.1 RND family transporter [Mycolicibacterium flavescens]